MIPYSTDPGLHAAEPPPPQLGDGFSPPPVVEVEAEPPQPATAAEAGALLGDISPF